MELMAHTNSCEKSTAMPILRQTLAVGDRVGPKTEEMEWWDLGGSVKERKREGRRKWNGGRKCEREG